MAQHRPCLARTKHVAVIDAVRPERHRWTPASSPCAPAFAAPARSPRSTVRSTSASIPSRSASIAGSNTPAFATDPLVIEHHSHRVRQTMHHMGDLLLQARRRPTRQLSACSGGHSNLALRTTPHRRTVDQGLAGPLREHECRSRARTSPNLLLAISAHAPRRTRMGPIAVGCGSSGVRQNPGAAGDPGGIGRGGPAS